MSVKPHHASGPAVNHLGQAELELSNKLLGCLWYPTIPLQLSDTLGHRQHLIDSLKEKPKGDRTKRRDVGTDGKELVKPKRQGFLVLQAAIKCITLLPLGVNRVTLSFTSNNSVSQTVCVLSYSRSTELGSSLI